MRQIKLTIFSIVILAASCRKHHEPDPPAKAVLSAPAQNETCTSGTVVSASQSTIVFKWNASANTESYELHLKDLDTKTESTQNSTTNELSVTVNRGKPYAWYVVSKSSKTTKTAQSDTWKFYCSAPGAVNYAPFPADLTSPAMDGSVTPTAGKITLSWSGSDPDNDIKEYDVYLGTTSTPALLKAAVSTTTLSDVTVTSGTTYYWKVVTKDTKGNTSESNAGQFKVN
ncbi:MAG TPA: hypothetical protein VNS32_19685 [Flavisolibacter sp.]|nr:hypothetical protein [Flavisolibacter sp.]